jgi:hypothetical protein
MISDNFALQPILTAFETVLYIDYIETNVATVIQNSRHSIENAFQITLTDTIYNLQVNNSFASEPLDEFLSRLSEPLKQLATLNAFIMYTKRAPIDLRDVHYMGFARNTLLTALKYLQDKNLHTHSEQVTSAFTSVIDNIPFCDIKRLLTVLLVLHSLGTDDVISVIAQTLYLGGLVL